MPHRKIWRIILCLTFSIFLLLGCNNNNNKNTSQENTTEISAKLTTETSEISATTPVTETAEEITPTAESETVRETTMAAEDVTWLEKALGHLFEKEPDEITEEDYLDITFFEVYIYNMIVSY